MFANHFPRRTKESRNREVAYGLAELRCSLFDRGLQLAAKRTFTRASFLAAGIATYLFTPNCPTITVQGFAVPIDP